MKTKKSLLLLLTVIFGALIFSFIFIKACTSSFTHDESFSYLGFTQDSFIEIISFSNWYTNNHILNSLCMKYSELIFGSSELALRLPNLILLLIYMLYSYLLFKGENVLLGLAIFILLCTNGLLIDLFGLARGYGLSMGFMMMGLYHFIEQLKKQKKIDLILFHFAALLASLSNFTLVTFYVTALIVYNIHSYINVKFILKEKFNLFKKNKVHLLPLIVVTAVLYEPLRRVISYSDLNFGGKNGFYADTINHLILNGIHGATTPAFVMIVLKLLFTLIVLFPFFILLKTIIKKRKDFFTKHTSLVISTLILIVISFIIVGQHVILKSDYPVGRFAVFLLPLFIVHTGFLLNYLIEIGYQKITLITTTILSVVSTVSFWSNTNLESSAEWGYDSKTKEMIHELNLDRQINNSTDKINLGINWLFEPTCNYYIKTQRLNWLAPVERDGVKESDDYLYLFEDEYNTLNTTKYTVIKRYKNIGTILLKRKPAA